MHPAGSSAECNFMKDAVRIPRQLLTLMLVVAGGVGGGLACTSVPEDIGVSDGRLRPCPFTPNCVNSETAEAPYAIEPLAYTGEAAQAFRSLLDLIEEGDEAELVTSEPGYAHFVFRTSLFRFCDDVELRLDEAAGVVHVRSASRMGFSDLGTNRRRIESLRRRWQPPGDEVPAPHL